MKPITELGLLACFGVEPSLLDEGVPWYYNTATYNFEVDGLAVSFVVEPAYYRVRLDVRREGRRLFAMNADWVVDLRVIDEPGVDAIELALSEQSWLRMQIRPAFEITQRFAS